MNERLSKSLYSPEWDAFRAILKHLRESSGLTQVQLSGRLKQAQSFVSKVESGQRKLDLRQFVIYVRALGADPAQVFAQFLEAFESEAIKSRPK